MEKLVITMEISKEDEGYSAYTSLGDMFIGTQGEDFNELKANIFEAVNLAFQDKGFTYSSEEIILKT